MEEKITWQEYIRELAEEEEKKRIEKISEEALSNVLSNVLESLQNQDKKQSICRI